MFHAEDAKLFTQNSQRIYIKLFAVLVIFLRSLRETCNLLLFKKFILSYGT
jgi:hypothetical protein